MNPKLLYNCVELSELKLLSKYLLVDVYIQIKCTHPQLTQLHCYAQLFNFLTFEVNYWNVVDMLFICIVSMIGAMLVPTSGLYSLKERPSLVHGS